MQMKLKNVRLAFPNIWKASAPQGGGEPAFSCSLLMPLDHPQLSELKKLMMAVATEKWGPKGASVYAALEKTGKLCLRDGGTKSEYEGFEGNLFVSCRGKVRPGLFNADRSDLTEADGVLYAGCYVNANIEVWAQDNEFGKRINAQPRGLQYKREGDAFGGGSRPSDSDDFDDEIADPEADLTA